MGSNGMKQTSKLDSSDAADPEDPSDEQIKIAKELEVQSLLYVSKS